MIRLILALIPTGSNPSGFYYNRTEFNVSKETRKYKGVQSVRIALALTPDRQEFTFPARIGTRQNKSFRLAGWVWSGG